MIYSYLFHINHHLLLRIQVKQTFLINLLTVDFEFSFTNIMQNLYLFFHQSKINSKECPNQKMLPK